MSIAVLGIRDYLAEVWQCRYFWYSLAKMDVRARYRRSVIGLGWSLLHPLSMTLVLCFVFHKIFGQDIGNYALFLMSGMMVWTFLAAAVSEGCLSFQRAEGYIRSHNAPLAIFPLRSILGISFHALMTLLLTIAFRLILLGPENLEALLFLVPTGGLLFLFGWSIAILFGLANAYFQDTQHLAQIGLQILFYLTPVLYPPGILEERGLEMIPRLNPLGSFFELVREPIIEGRWPPLSALAIAMGLTAVTSLLAVYLLGKLERKIVFQL